MKKSFIILMAAFMLSGFSDRPKKMQRQRGVMITTPKGFEFVPLEDWHDYTPKQFDTCFRYRFV